MLQRLRAGDTHPMSCLQTELGQVEINRQSRRSCRTCREAQQVRGGHEDCGGRPDSKRFLREHADKRAAGGGRVMKLKRVFRS